MNEEENIVGKHSDGEEFIRAAKGSVPATSTDTPNTSAAPHVRTFRGPGRMMRIICTELTALGWLTGFNDSQKMGLSVHDDDFLNRVDCAWLADGL